MDGRHYAYVKGAGSYVHYDTTFTDAGTGFWKGTVTLAGPRGPLNGYDLYFYDREGNERRSSGGGTGPEFLLRHGRHAGQRRTSGGALRFTVTAD